jgi:hypothetical protein
LYAASRHRLDPKVAEVVGIQACPISDKVVRNKDAQKTFAEVPLPKKEVLLLKREVLLLKMEVLLPTVRPPRVSPRSPREEVLILLLLLKEVLLAEDVTTVAAEVALAL